MTNPRDRATKIACIVIAIWFALVIVLALTVPFRQPPKSQPQTKADAKMEPVTNECVLLKAGDVCVWRPVWR